MSDLPVTVLLAVHNGAVYLAEAIQSVRSQHFPDFELVIVDDASNDETPQILAEQAREDDRIRILRNPENLGLTRSLNRGLGEARGRLVARLDADDLSHPDRLGRQHEFFESHPRCRLLATPAVTIDADGSSAGTVTEYFEPGTLAVALLFRNPLIHSSIMFHREFVRRCGGYDESYRFAQDYELWLRLLHRGAEPAMLSDPLVSRRVHRDAISGTRSVEQLRCHLLAQQHWLGEILGVPCGEATLRLIRQPYRETAATAAAFWRLLRCSRQITLAMREKAWCSPSQSEQLRAEVDRYLRPLLQTRADRHRHWHDTAYVHRFVEGGGTLNFLAEWAVSEARKHRGRATAALARARKSP